MELILGTTLPVFIGLTIILMGGCAFLMGQAMATGWKPLGFVVIYSALLGLADRFLLYALFEGELLTLSGYLIHAVILFGIAWISYALTRARRMVTQYPWLYERTGPFTWRPRSDTADV